MIYPIEAKWKLSWEVWCRANTAHRQAAFPLWLRFVIFGGVVLMLIPGKNDDGLMWSALAAGFLVVWFAGIRFVLLPYVWRKTFKSLAFRDEAVVWKFFEDRFETAAGATASRVEWRVLTKAVVLKDGVLLYPQRNLSYWVPCAGFASSEEFSRFVELVKSRVPKTKVMR